MSEENVEVVRRAIDANRSGSPEDTVERAMALADPNCVFTSRLTSVGGAAYQGHQGARAYFADMADAWREWRHEVNEMTEVGPNAVLTQVTFRATGKSGVDVAQRIAMVWVLSGRRILEIHSYPSRQEALEAVGLSE